MRELLPDMSQTPADESKKSIFDSHKFWGKEPRHRNSLNINKEKSPIKINEDPIAEVNLDAKEDSIMDSKETSILDSKEDLILVSKEDSILVSKEDSILDSKEDSIPNAKEPIPKQVSDQSDPSTVKVYETLSGNSIITRGWDGNNMSVFKTRRKIQ